MDKIKNVFKPGQSQDDEILYGATSDANKGKVAGEGSHFGAQEESATSKLNPSTAVADTSDASSTTAVKHGVPGDAQEATGYHPSRDHGTSQTTTAGDNYNTASGSGLAGQQQTSTTSTPIYNQYSSQRADPKTDNTAAAIGAAGTGAGAHTTRNEYNEVPAGTTSSALNTNTVGATAPSSSEPRSTTGQNSHDSTLAGGIPATGSSNHPPSSTTAAGGIPTTSSSDHPSSSTTASGGIPATGSSNHPSSSTAATGISTSGAQTSTSGGYTGPVHDSRFLNELDPRVHKVSQPDSSVRHGEPIGATSVGGGSTSSYQAPTGTAVSGSSTSQVPPSGTHGATSTPHGSSAQDTSRSAIPAAVGGAALGSAAASHSGRSEPVQTTSQPTATSTSVPSSTAYNSSVPQHSEPSTTRTGTHTGPIGSAVTTSGHDSSNPYSSTPLDSRVNPHQESTGPTSSTGSSHHHGRDAALGGAAAGVAGAGYEAQKHHGSSEPSTAADNGSSRQAGTGSHIAGEPGITSGNRDQARLADRTGPGYEKVQTTDQPKTEHHHGRDAALGAGVVGAGGAAAHGLSKDHDRPAQDTYGQQTSAQPGYNQQPQTTHESHPARDTALATGAAGAGAGAAGGTATYGATRAPEQHTQPLQQQSAQQPEKREHHLGRDAAGAAGAGGAAYGIDEAAEKKKIEKQQKEHEKELKHEQREHDKQIKKEEKQLEKEEKKAEKNHEKEIKEREKEAGDEHDQKKKSGGGLLGFLHRDKNKGEDDKSHKRESEEAALVGAGAAGTGAAVHHHNETDPQGHDYHAKNRLHKDPPADSVMYAEAPSKGYASTVTGGTGTTQLAQGESLPRGSHATTFGNVTDPSIKSPGTTGDGIVGEESQPKYRDNVTGGTGTTELAQGDNISSGSHATALGNKAQPAHNTSIITEPRTGLPMDLSKGEHDGRGTDHLPGGSSGSGAI